MPRPARLLILPLSAASSVVLLGGGVASADLTDERILGLDVSAWQGNISQTTWNNIQSVENRQFVFIRSSRGGTTGEDHLRGGYPANDDTEFWGSQRYDDLYYVQNMNRATTAGMFAGSYHFSRPDVLATTPNSNPPGGTAGVANTGTDEANHFIQMAGPFMRPGYLLPVHDLEAGDGDRTPTEMAQFTIDFSNRIYEVMGIRPAIYINGNYNTILAGGTASQRNQLAQPPANLPSVVGPAYPQLWIARWPNQADPNSIPVQTAHPKDSVSTIYGPWDDYGTTHPWVFWQYASTGRLQSFNNGGSNLDFDVAQGDIEFLKNQLVPAVWMNDSSGDWSTLLNWNSGQPVITPPQAPGQLAPIGTQTLPTPRLPGAAGSGPTAGSNDTVILERPNANITVTLSSGTHNVRKLYMRETLNITGGSLTINYDPTYRANNLSNVAHAGPISAQFSGPVTMSGGSLTAHTIQVDPTRTFTAGGNANLTINTLTLQRHSTTPAKLLVNGNVNVNGLSGATAVLNTNAAAGTTGSIDLAAGNRTFNVGNGAAAIDLDVLVPITNGTLTKSGLGTMRLNVANTISGTTTINDGILDVTGSNQLGSGGVVTNMTVVTPGSSGHGGTLRLNNGVSYGNALTIAGGGLNGVSTTAPGSTGALHSNTGTNTWSGTITLAGAGSNGNDPTINQVSAASGATLALTGVVQNSAGVTATLAKSGDGDLVLGGTAGNNTYSGLTRVYGGRIIVEKNQALGTPGSNNGDATGNTFLLPNSNTAVAFRAPASSPAGFTYGANEWIFTEGSGVNSVQIDNLGGANTFNGSLALGGPVVNGTQEAYLGVSSGSLEIQGGLHTRSTTSAQARNIFKRGAGTLILSGLNAAAPTTGSARGLVNSTFTVQSGAVELRGAGANHPGITAWNVSGAASLALNSVGVDSTITGSVSGTGAMNKSGAGVVTLAGAINGFAGAVNVSAGTLAVAASGADSSVAIANGLTINTGPGAKLDLFDNDLIVRTTSAAAVEALVAGGHNDGAWNGSGIMSTSAQSSLGLYTLGVASNATIQTSTFDGHTGLTGADTFVKYTVIGDADLSGVVNGLDFLRFKAGFEGTQSDVWAFGDFDYSGVVDSADFALYFQGYLNQPGGSVPTGSLHNDMMTFALDYGLDTSLIPEPGSLSLVALSAGLMLRRRRRRS